jgi:hypothetical protein
MDNSSDGGGRVAAVAPFYSLGPGLGKRAAMEFLNRAAAKQRPFSVAIGVAAGDLRT